MALLSHSLFVYMDKTFQTDLLIEVPSLGLKKRNISIGNESIADIVHD